MTKNQVEIFKMLVEYKTMSEVAERRFSSVTSIHKTIKNLEKELDTELFHRTPTGYQLTKTGEILYQYSDKIDALFEEMLEKIAESTIQTSQITIGIDSNAINPLQEKLLDSYPNKNIFKKYYSPCDSFRDLLDHNIIDIFFSAAIKKNLPKKYLFIPICSLNLCVAYNNNGKFSGTEEATIKELLNSNCYAKPNLGNKYIHEYSKAAKSFETIYFNDFFKLEDKDALFFYAGLNPLPQGYSCAIVKDVKMEVGYIIRNSQYNRLKPFIEYTKNYISNLLQNK